MKSSAMRQLACLAVLLLLPGCFTLDFDGDGTIDRGPVAGYETDFVSCTNGYDDDLDGRVDCADEDCLMAGFCAEYIPLTPPLGVENTFELCTNGIDDDLDGQFDCGDRDCSNILELCCSGEINNADCQDGIDNDGNGFADCRDFSCSNNPFVTVCDEETDCDNGRDDDGDRLTDCLDPDCACEERVCDDGRDNDANGRTDCEDPACSGVGSCPSETNCEDGLDDDGDGRIDCADPECQVGTLCNGPEDTLARCSDGYDNDGNGFSDCGDFSCSRSMDSTITDYCDSITEATVERCSDGVDNDGNGFTDCEDFSCSRADDMAVVEYCRSIGENTIERCSDGVDNDDNGFIDCEDFSCSRADDMAVVQFCREAGEGTEAACQDGIDNDGNGFIDCGDFGCRFQTASFTGLCSNTPECPIGQSCFRGACLSILSPCLEGAAIEDVRLIPTGDPMAARVNAFEAREMVVRQCTDGLDNDNDGFTDCEDWECNHNPLAVDVDGNPICTQGEGLTCVAGPRVGQSCAEDGDCGVPLAGACVRAGRPGSVFVCP
ncbi:MAG TPA: hypothetical protein ENK57_10380 [Polyangiaceae bacterium]|nr:hypothetical protein [Polyangiaceae bacterium]